MDRGWKLLQPLETNALERIFVLVMISHDLGFKFLKSRLGDLKAILVGSPFELASSTTTPFYLKQNGPRRALGDLNGIAMGSLSSRAQKAILW